MFARFCIVAAVAGLTCLLPGEAAPATIESILNDWKTRRDMVDTAKYVAKGTVTIPRGVFNDDLPEDAPRGTNLPADDYTYPTEFTWTIDFKNGRMRRKWRREVFYMTTREFIPDVTVEAYDGNVIRRWEPRSENTSENFIPSDAQVEIYDNMQMVLRTTDLGILFAHGQFYLRSMPEHKSLFNRAIEKDDVAIVGTGDHDGRRCAILRSSPRPGDPPQSYDEFWVDSGRDSAVVRWVQMLGGGIVYSTEIRYGEVEGHWLPREVYFDNYMGSRSGVPVSSTKLHMEEITLNRSFPVEEFQIKPEKGMVVEDAATGEQYRFGQRKSGGGYRRSIFIALTVLISVALIAAWIRRRRRKAM